MSFKVSEYNYWMTHATKIRCKEADNLKWIRLKTQCFKVDSYYETLRGGGNFFSLERPCTIKAGFFHMKCVIR